MTGVTCFTKELDSPCAGRTRMGYCNNRGVPTVAYVPHLDHFHATCTCQNCSGGYTGSRCHHHACYRRTAANFCHSRGTPAVVGPRCVCYGCRNGYRGSRCQTAPRATHVGAVRVASNSYCTNSVMDNRQLSRATSLHDCIRKVMSQQQVCNSYFSYGTSFRHKVCICGRRTHRGHVAGDRRCTRRTRTSRSSHMTLYHIETMGAGGTSHGQCTDRMTTAFCHQMRRTYNCHTRLMRRGCLKTCGHCTVVSIASARAAAAAARNANV